MAELNDIVLYHYSFSPYARRILWYLALRGIGYAECVQSHILPRPDLQAIGVNYRRIPVMAHGQHAYCDTRRILSHLEQAFPPSQQHPSIAPSTPFERGFTQLIAKWMVEANIFAASSGLLPVDLPVINDPNFLKDREQLTGRAWNKETILRNRPANLVVMKEAFAIVEEQILGDGREWVLGTSGGPSLADIEAVWPFHWLMGLPGALPAESVSSKQFPRVFAWVKRFQDAVSAAKKKAPKPAKLDGKQAAKQVLYSRSQPTGFVFDVKDPTRLGLGQPVEVVPIDSGFSHRDRGRLVGLNSLESVIEAKSPGGETIYIHFPRSGFRILPLDVSKL